MIINSKSGKAFWFEVQQFSKWLPLIRICSSIQWSSKYKSDNLQGSYFAQFGDISSQLRGFVILVTLKDDKCVKLKKTPIFGNFFNFVRRQTACVCGSLCVFHPQYLLNQLAYFYESSYEHYDTPIFEICNRVYTPISNTGIATVQISEVLPHYYPLMYDYHIVCVYRPSKIV
jgi:hypothetical protein